MGVPRDASGSPEVTSFSEIHSPPSALSDNLDVRPSFSFQGRAPRSPACICPSNWSERAVAGLYLTSGFVWTSCHTDCC